MILLALQSLTKSMASFINLLKRVTNVVKFYVMYMKDIMGTLQPPGKKRPTSSDVARLAGVSRTTVSFIMNGVDHVSISDKTRTRVLEAIKSLDYHPHEPARSLSRRSSNMIGVSIPDSHNPHYYEMVEGIEQYAALHSYNIVLSVAAFNLEREQRCLEWLKQQRIDGLIMIPSSGRAFLQEMRKESDHGYAITTVGLTTAGFNDTNIDYVCNEEQMAARLAIEHLISLGHRAIGYIYGVSDQSIFGGRLQSCLNIQRSLGLPIVDEWICRCGPTQDDGYRATKALLQSYGTNRPTALVTSNDLMGTSALVALAEAGITVPSMMSVISFDNTPLARFSLPALTSIDFDAHALGRDAARLVIDRLSSPQRAPQLVEIPARLIERHSTAPAPGVP